MAEINVSALPKFELIFFYLSRLKPGSARPKTSYFFMKFMKEYETLVDGFLFKSASYCAIYFFFSMIYY